MTMDTLNGSRAHCYLDDMQRGFTNEHSPIHTPQVGEADLRRKEDLGMDKDKAACRPSIDRKCAVDLDLEDALLDAIRAIEGDVKPVIIHTGQG